MIFLFQSVLQFLRLADVFTFCRMVGRNRRVMPRRIRCTADTARITPSTLSLSIERERWWSRSQWSAEHATPGSPPHWIDNNIRTHFIYKFTLLHNKLHWNLLAFLHLSYIAGAVINYISTKFFLLLLLYVINGGGEVRAVSNLVVQ